MPVMVPVDNPTKQVILQALQNAAANATDDDIPNGEGYLAVYDDLMDESLIIMDTAPPCMIEGCDNKADFRPFAMLTDHQGQPIAQLQPDPQQFICRDHLPRTAIELIGEDAWLQAWKQCADQGVMAQRDNLHLVGQNLADGQVVDLQQIKIARPDLGGGNGEAANDQG